MRRRRRGLEADRRTIFLGGLATTALGALVAAEYGRVWRRGSAPLPQETDDVLSAAEAAAVETAAVALAGYRETPDRENALFNLLSSFAATFLAARGTTYLLRTRKTVGPFRNLTVGRRHIHHFVPGIVLGFAAGAVAIVTRNEELEPRLAVPFGIGMGLTLDESALLLELDDVYWTREGLLSVQITLSLIAVLASLALGLRFLRRGEQVVLEAPPAPAGSA
ncbi:MAG TPA: hypothetical protein VGF21_15705 [Thermoleophilaceae bacterium]